MDIEKKREREKQMVSEMIHLYCRKMHLAGGDSPPLCADCVALDAYARMRSDNRFV